MQRARVFLLRILILLLATQAWAADRKNLDARISAILSDPELARGFWGIDVASLPSGKAVYGQNEDKLFTPASNTKLFTTAAVLALIGPNYRFRTTLETTGTVDRYGRLTGDLVLVGRGDPNLSGRTLPYNVRTERAPDAIKALEDLADALVQKGVKYIDGDVVADDSYFAFERYGEGWSQDDLIWGDGAPVSALTINDNVVFVSILPADRPGERAFVNVSPYADYYRLDNRIMTTPQGTGPRKIYINREPGSNLLTLWGNIPLDDAGANEALAIDDPADFAARLLRQLLQKRGIVVYGKPRTHHTELANLSTFSVTTLASAGGGDERQPRPLNQPLVLASYQSQPLVQDLRVINKVSQNLHAEILLRLLGREKGASGTIEGGMEVVRGFLTQAGVAPDEYIFYDGSGLSRQNLVTPHAIVKLLEYADKQPWVADYLDSFPLAGMDGSLAERFHGTPAQGRVRAKTGSLGHVKALSGYLTTLKGERLAFSIMANNQNVPSKTVLDAVDAIVNALVDDSKK